MVTLITLNTVWNIDNPNDTENCMAAKSSFCCSKSAEPKFCPLFSAATNAGSDCSQVEINDIKSFGFPTPNEVQIHTIKRMKG